MDMSVGEEATVDNSGHRHYSAAHGEHGDLYFIRKISDDEVEIEKLHTDEL